MAGILSAGCVHGTQPMVQVCCTPSLMTHDSPMPQPPMLMLPGVRYSSSCLLQRCAAVQACSTSAAMPRLPSALARARLTAPLCHTCVLCSPAASRAFATTSQPSKWVWACWHSTCSDFWLSHVPACHVALSLNLRTTLCRHLCATEPPHGGKCNIRTAGGQQRQWRVGHGLRCVDMAVLSWALLCQVIHTLACI